PTIVGLEWAGQIVGVGKDVKTLKPGQFVACRGLGAYAEYAVTDEQQALPFDPKVLDIKQAAALPLALMTAHDALKTRGQLEKGQSVLVNGATSGVGIATSLVAKYLGAGTIAGTSRDPVKQRKLPEYGVNVVLDSSKPDWADKLLAATNNEGVDIVIDM